MSRATIIDERPEEELEATDQLDTQDTVETPQEEEQPQEPNVPEKYQGKSVEELVQMHQELEKFSGKQSTEVGELRKVVDSYIQTELSNQQAPQEQQQEDDEVDFFVDPQTAVNRAIDNHPKIKAFTSLTHGEGFGRPLLEASFTGLPIITSNVIPCSINLSNLVWS